MKPYLDVLRNVYGHGVSKDNRTGVGTKYLFSEKFRCDLRDGFPLLTTKKINFAKVAGEMFGFLSGANSIQEFQKFDCGIWDAWGLKSDYFRLLQLKKNEYYKPLAEKLDISEDEAKELLSKVETNFQQWNDDYAAAIAEIANGKVADPTNQNGYDVMNDLLAKKPETVEEYLQNLDVSLYVKDIIYPEGYLGPIYGKQWLEWRTSTGVLINQIKRVANQLSDFPMSRRIIVSGWNPEVIPDDRYTTFPDGTVVVTSDDNIQASILDGKQALPPCHLMTILDVQATEDSMILNLHLTMRSTDVPIGLPFNIASYALLLTMIAENHGMIPGQLVIEMVNCHIYADQMDLVPTQLERDVKKLPTLKLPKGLDYADPATLTREAFEAVVAGLEGYEHHPFIKYPVAV
jgi:thymidylate synthase